MKVILSGALMFLAAFAGADEIGIDVSADVEVDTSGCDSLDPAACLFPFPNDFFTVEDSSTDTGRRVRFSPLAMPANVFGKPIDPTDWNRADGFSPGQLIVTKVPGLDTPEAFARTGAVPIIDIGRYLDPDQPVVVIDAETLERHPIWSEIDRGEDLERNPPSQEDTALFIRPAVNFKESARYIVALRDLRDANGDLLPAGEAFRIYRDGIPTTSPRIESRRAHMEDVFNRLEQAGIPRQSLYLAWDFTVASRRSITGRMLAIRDDAFAELGDTDLDDLEVEGRAPVYVVTKVTNFTLEENARIARRVEGTFAVPCYLDQPGCPPGARFAFTPLSETPLRAPGNTHLAPFICNIPRVAVDGNEPAKLSLYGHGLFGSADEVNTKKLAELGNDHDFVFCATDWAGMSESDIPNAVTITTDLSRFPTLVDRVQQGMLNFLYLGRLMIHPEGFRADPAFQFLKDGEMRPVIDATRLFYDGGSQGGIIGGALTAVAPDFTRAALGVPAMNYSTLLRRSVDFDDFAQVLYPVYPDELERPLILSLIQMLWDRGDANGYAHHIAGDPLPDTPAHMVLMQIAYGDHQVTNWAAAVEARTIGAKIRAPILDPGRSNEVVPFFGISAIESFPFAGTAITVWDVGPLRTVSDKVKGTPPPPPPNVPNRLGVDPHGPDASETPEGQAQIAEFLESGVVIDTCADHPCYLDGWQGPGSGT